MMKSLLFNNNNTIKDCLVMWKDNLDKEFEGLEECPICYYVILYIYLDYPRHNRIITKIILQDLHKEIPFNLYPQMVHRKK